VLTTVAPIVAPARAAQVPLDDLAGILVVSATVNGKGPYHFVLDTGAGITVVTPRLAQAIGVAAAASDIAHGTTDQTVAVRLATLATLTIGAATQTNVAAAIVPLPPDLTYQGAYGTIDGIVGATFLRNYAVTFDIAAGRATLTPVAAFKPPDGFGAIPLTFTTDTVPVVSANVENATGRFELDSGNNDDVLLTQSFTRAYGIGAGYQKPVHTEYVGVGGSAGATRVRLESMSLGPFVMHGVPADISEASSNTLQRDGTDGNFGYDVFRQFVVTIDYGSKRLYLQPSSGFNALTVVAGTGIIPRRNADGTFSIVNVLAGSAAANAGVKAGETIVAIDGTPAARMSGADYHAAVGSKVGTPVTYTLTSGTSTRTLTIVTVDLLPVIPRYC
jgi:predicted aspartyl protease